MSKKEIAEIDFVEKREMRQFISPLKGRVFLPQKIKRKQKIKF